MNNKTFVEKMGSILNDDTDEEHLHRDKKKNNNCSLELEGKRNDFISSEKFPLTKNFVQEKIKLETQRFTSEESNNQLVTKVKLSQNEKTQSIESKDVDVGESKKKTRKNIKASLSSKKSDCVVFECKKKVRKINCESRPSHDTILKNLCSTEKENKLINNSSSNDGKMSETICKDLSISHKNPRKSQIQSLSQKIKLDTHAFNSEEDNKLLIIKVNLSQSGRICSIESDNVDVVETETQTYKSTKTSVSKGESSCGVDGNKEVSEANSDTRPSHDSILKNVCTTDKKNELIKDDVTSKDKEMSEVVCKQLIILHKSPPKSQIKSSNNCNVIDLATTPDENQNFIEPLYTEIDISNKQSVSDNSEKEDHDSIIPNGNWMGISVKDHEGKNHKNSRDVENIQLGIRKVQNVSNEKKTCVEIISEDVSLTRNKSELNCDYVLSNKEKAEASCQDLSILRSRSETDEVELEILCENKRDDSDISVVYDSKKDDAFERELTSDDSSKEKKSNSRNKIYKEIDYELGVLKTKYLNMERKLGITATVISKDTVQFPLSAMKKELTSFKLSLEKLKERFSNKCSHAKSEIFEEQFKPSCSYQQKYSEKDNETKTDMFNYTSKKCTRLTKKTHSLCNAREFHHSYEHTQMSAEMSDRYRPKTRHPSCSKREMFEMDRKKYKLSHFEDERDFPRFPEKKIKNCSKKCYLANYTCYKKKTVGDQSERETKFCSYSHKEDYAHMRSISKSYVAEEQLSSKLDSRKYLATHNSLINRASISSSSSEDNKYSPPRIQTRQKVSKRHYRKICKLRKFDNEHGFSSDTSISSQTSSTTDRELTPVYFDPQYHRGHYKYLNKMSTIVKSIKKDKLPSRRKRLRESEYEKEAFHMNSNDSDFYNPEEENLICSGKRQKKHKEKKRIHSLITRQINTINEHVSRKSDLMKSVNNFSKASNIIEKYEEENDSNEEKFEGEVNFQTDVASSPEYSKKKKCMSEQHTRPFKLAKGDSHTDVHNVLKKKQKSQSYYEKLQSSNAAPSSSKSNLSVEEKCEGKKEVNRSKIQTCRARYEMSEQSVKENDFDQKKFNIKSYEKLQSMGVAPSSSTSTLQGDKNFRNKKETKTLNKQYFEARYQMEEENEKEFDNFDNRVIETHNDVVEANRNETHKQETPTIKEMEEFLLFLKKKRLEDVSQEKNTVAIAQEHEYKGGNVKKIDPKNVSMQESQKITKTDLGNSKNITDKLQTTAQIPKKPSKETEQKLEGKKMKKQNIGIGNKSLSVCNSSLDLFKKLNLEIQKKK